MTVRAESVKSRPELCIDAEEKKKKNKKNNNNNEVNPEMADASYEGIRDAIVKPLLVEVSLLSGEEFERVRIALRENKANSHKSRVLRAGLPYGLDEL